MTAVQSAAHWCFAGAAPGGALTLQWPAAADGAHDAVAAALALADCEPLLALLEAWLGLPIDPAPAADSGPGGAAGVIAAELDDAALAPPGTRIGVPWALLARRPAPPDALRELRWAALHFEVELATFAQSPLPADFSRDDGDGGALLLPPSFEPGWPLRLYEASHGLQWLASWNGTSAEAMPAVPPQPGLADPARWRVVLDAPLRVEIAHALGWTAARHAPLPAVLPAPFAAACTARLLAPGRSEPEARGGLVPMLRGAGLAWGPLREALAGPPLHEATATAIATPQAAVETPWT